MPRVQTRLDSRTGFVNASSPHLVWRSSRATPCARYLAPRTSHPPRVTFSPRRKIGVGGGFLFDFSGSILRVLRDSAPPLPKMLWPWRRGSGFVTATCHMHAVCVYSPSTLGRSPTPLGRPGSFVSRGGPSSLGIHFGSRGSGHFSPEHRSCSLKAATLPRLLGEVL